MGRRDNIVAALSAGIRDGGIRCHRPQLTLSGSRATNAGEVAPLEAKSRAESVMFQQQVFAGRTRNLQSQQTSGLGVSRLLDPPRQAPMGHFAASGLLQLSCEGRIPGQQFKPPGQVARKGPLAWNDESGGYSFVQRREGGTVRPG